MNLLIPLALLCIIFVPGAGIELYEFSTPFGYIFLAVKSTSKALRSPWPNKKA
jgi:hypothetical protein